MTVAGTLDTREWDAALAKLAGPLREHLARSMGVAGGQVMRDEAKLLAPKDSGVLADAIYLAFRDKESTEARVVYRVTWNARKAPHGHLLEFGHWQPYTVVRLPDGSYFTDKSRPLPQPKWIPAHPFLRPAMGAWPQAQSAMIRRGRQRLPELLAGAIDEP